MIIMRMSGWLGNQLFQYALGRTLALRTGSELKLDTHLCGHGHRKEHYFSLPHFNISAEKVSLNDFKRIGMPDMQKEDTISRLERKIFRTTEYFRPLNKRKILLEPTFTFSPEILEITGDAYLSGVWQSEKYFAEIQSTLQKDLTLKKPLSPTAKRMAEKIHTPGINAVSLHIRRNDYVSNPKTRQLHGGCSLEYYAKAAQIISEKVSRPVFFIFSDDMVWVKNNVKLEFPTVYVSDENRERDMNKGQEEIPDYEELILMSRCRHHIIANSSFSWWGAWLNPNKEKIVIAPRQWFARGDIDTKDLILDSWVKI